MKHRHVILGTLFWLASAITGWLVLRGELADQSSSVGRLTASVGQWFSGQQEQFVSVSDRPMLVALGDPVILEQPDGTFRQIGLVTSIDDSSLRDPVAVRQFQVQIYTHAIDQFPEGFHLEHHTTPLALDWVVSTMIPDHRRQQIAELIQSEWKLHQKELLAELRPVIREGIRTALRAVEAELPRILQLHRSEFLALSDRYETEILKAEILPLVREEILPIVEEETLPLAEDVGRALWKRVSIWSFGWRLLYDKSPLPQRDAVKAEFQRFVEEEAMPELESRTDQLIKLTEDIVRRSLENARVKEALKRNLRRLAEDPELQSLVWKIVREAVVENATLRRALETYLKQQQTDAAMQLATERMEPMVREIGDLIFGRRETGITPEFSRVLRSQILNKDRRWLMIRSNARWDGALQNGIPGQIQTIPGRTEMDYPLVYGGAEHSPLTPDLP